MVEVFSHPTQLANWQAAADGQAVDWDEVLMGYNATIDWPGAHYWRNLAEIYPEAKILLSVRPPEYWWRSFSNTIKVMLELRDAIPYDYPRSVATMAYQIIAEQTFAGLMDDKISVLSAFHQRVDAVKRAIAPERLLIFNVADGWPPLCQFLNVPIPTRDFPHINYRQKFLEVFDFRASFIPPHFRA